MYSSCLQPHQHLSSVLWILANQLSVQWESHCALNLHFPDDIFFFFCLFMIAPVAYRSSRARGWIGATAEVYGAALATPDQSCIFDLCDSSWQGKILSHWVSQGSNLHLQAYYVRFLACWVTMKIPLMWNIFFFSLQCFCCIFKISQTGLWNHPVSCLGSWTS